MECTDRGNLLHLFLFLVDDTLTERICSSEGANSFRKSVISGYGSKLKPQEYRLSDPFHSKSFHSFSDLNYALPRKKGLAYTNTRRKSLKNLCKSTTVSQYCTACKCWPIDQFWQLHDPLMLAGNSIQYFTIPRNQL